MRKILTVVVLLTIIFLLIRDVNAQEKVYLPVIFSEGNKMACEYPILAISNGEERINLLDEGSGLQLADPYWSPNIAQLKGGGTFVDPQTADGRSLVSANYGNVIETIPIRITGEQGWITIRNLRRMLNLSVNAQAYWTQIFEQDRVWMEVLPKGDNFLTGYSTIYTISIPNITSPYTRPFANPIDKSQFDTINIILEREPFFSPLQPGEIIGPLYNLIKNPDFELWNFGVGDSQPDSWDDLQTISIIGTNNRTQSDVKWGNNAIKVSVTGSTAIGEAKGVTQVIEDTGDGITYTVLAWVKNDGISNGVGRILITYSDQLELYRDDSIHGWQLYSGTITTGLNDTVGISIEILSTGNNTLGDVFFDGLMFIEGDWADEAADNLIGYMTSSHIVNHQDKQTGTVEPGDINFVDMWNIPGDVDSKIRLEFVNNTVPANDNNPIEIYRTLRVGMRRTGNVFNFDNYNDSPGLNDTNASSDDYLETLALSSDWLDILSKVITGPNNVQDNEGRFKAIARIYDEKSSGDSDLDIRMRYYTGTSGINEVVLNKEDSQIRANYTIVDLTSKNPINLDVKFKNPTPGQLGYNIDMKRDSGTDKARIDYTMLIPTDGGYFNTDIEPSLTNGNSIVVDNTGQLTVTATNRAAGWLKLFNTQDNAIYGIKEFKGDIYFGVSSGVWRLRNGVFTKTLDIDLPLNGAYLVPLEVFNGELYCVVNEDVGGGLNEIRLYKSSDGIAWTNLGELQNSVGGSLSNGAWARGLTSFKNKLWIVVDELTLNAYIYNYDGTTLILNQTITVGPPATQVTNFTIFQNKLYVKYKGDLYELDDINETWSSVADFDVWFYIETFNDKIFGMTEATDTILSWDGSTVVTEETLSFRLRAHVMDVYDNQLYIGGFAGATPNPVIFSPNGQDWTRATLQSGIVQGIGNFQGVLYIGAGTSGAAIIYTYSQIDNSYTVSNYQGTGFSAPPRTLQSDSRHRYFFSYDRENFVNNIDDKALIGIGYRPRYFSLINKDEF